MTRATDGIAASGDGAAASARGSRAPEVDLGAILRSADVGGESVGIALVREPGASPESAWMPAGAGAEPGYLAYSITKTLIAALVLSLRDEGRVSLDDPLGRWFPRVAAADRISLRRLLDHTAGIPDYGSLPEYHAAVREDPSAPWSFERFAAETFDRGLAFEPGTGWAYSNPGYLLLKRIAEEVGGAPFARLVADRVARPLGLERTFVAESLADLAGLAPAPSRAVTADGSARDVRARYHPGWVSHGVVASTPSDVARFFDALFGGRLVSPASIHEMTALTPVPEAVVDPLSGWKRPGYGLGLMGDAASRWGRLWGHNGGGPGYRASAFHAPDLGATVCAMGALEGALDPEALVLAALDRVAGAARP